MPCDTIKFPDGTKAIICRRGQRYPKCGVPGCDRRAPFLCDHPLKNGKTCDRKLCEAHATSPEGRPDVHACPAHVKIQGVLPIGGIP